MLLKSGAHISRQCKQGIAIKFSDSSRHIDSDLSTPRKMRADDIAKVHSHKSMPSGRGLKDRVRIPKLSSFCLNSRFIV